MSPSTSTTTFFTLGLLVLLILGVQASPLQQQQQQSTLDENNNGAGAAVDSIVLSRGSVGQAAAASNPFLEKALQRASFRLSQLPSSSSNGNSDSGDFFSSLRDRVYLIRPFARNPFTRKRSCFINAGMGNNCDFKDLISAASARRIWQSPNSPGKKRSVLPALTSSSSSSDESSPSSSSAELLRNYLAAVAANEPALNSPSSSSYSSSVQKRMQCISGLPGGDCENSFLGGESLGQDFLRPGGRNPGRR
ncbi:hypothetical protein TYRP_015223 [Tyrophagus putrescentiae]|nr:hypothetical protein TYRP_015223 [Tyrophagus putrescentiae]